LTNAKASLLSSWSSWKDKRWKHRLGLATAGKPPLPLEELLNLATQITDGLDVAHAKGIIHRDIKPANLFVTLRGQAKILDFGLAKLTPTVAAASSPPSGKVGDEDPSLRSRAGIAARAREEDAATMGSIDLAHLTTPGVPIGTAAYMSPEQVRGEDLDRRTDLFSLGAVLYEMATGRQAFSGNTSGVLFDAILNRAPTPAARVIPRSGATRNLALNWEALS